MYPADRGNVIIQYFWLSNQITLTGACESNMFRASVYLLTAPASDTGREWNNYSVDICKVYPNYSNLFKFIRRTNSWALVSKTLVLRLVSFLLCYFTAIMRKYWHMHSWALAQHQKIERRTAELPKETTREQGSLMVITPCRWTNALSFDVYVYTYIYRSRK